MSNEAPPPFDHINSVHIHTGSDHKIAKVNVYAGLAEVTRVYKLALKTGQNSILISGLPNKLDDKSVRVEGRGSATIHDVAVSRTQPQSTNRTESATLSSLLLKLDRIQRPLKRCRITQSAVDSFLSSVDAEHVDVAHLGNIVDAYETTSARIDEGRFRLEEEVERLEKQIAEERARIAGPVVNPNLKSQVNIGMFAERDGDVEVALVYAVNCATWVAAYDIRVNGQTKASTIKVVYKACITQDSGERWANVPLTLETATPTFGVGLPVLPAWNLSVYKPQIYRRGKRDYNVPEMEEEELQESDEDMGFGLFDDNEEPAMAHAGASVSSRGHVSATFRIPGRTTIPSDGAVHMVTIADLVLEAVISWVAVPKMDTRTHLNAKITNTSEYTLLAGKANIYVDGSFISKSDMKSVRPGETFDCSLGLDPSINITYLPITKSTSQSGLFTKNSTCVFSQRIIIHNTKSIDIDRVKIIDQVPVSQDAQLVVKVLRPELQSGGHATSVKVMEGVVAFWEGADSPDCDVEKLGTNGSIVWICAVPSQKKVTLELEWEVTSPLTTRIIGLDG